MSILSRDDIIVQKLNKAKETLLAAENLLKDDLFNSAVNRLYYCCFYAASALLYKKNIHTKSHTGVQQMLGLHFIKNGVLEKELGELYSELFQNRLSSDYDDFVSLEQEYVKELHQFAVQFLYRVEEILTTI